MLQASTLKFLRDLKKNNQKAWFDLHRPAYEEAKQDFEKFIQQLIDRHGKKDETISGLQARKCLFRINRDVRFSKDKSPYKTNFGAYINGGGKKSILGGYYFHLEPGASFAGGGLWMPQPAELRLVRQEIDYCFDEFRKILSARKFKTVFGDLSRGEEYSLVKVPQGFEKDNPAAEYLKLKSFVALRPVTDKELLSGSLLKNSMAIFEALQPLLTFLNRSFHQA
jgi:uncharacterized protein (TIGR02453 family)